MIAVITEQRMREIGAQIVGTYVNLDGAVGNQCWDSVWWIMEKYFGLPRINTGNTAEKAGRWPGWAGNMVDCYPQSPAIEAAYELLPPGTPGLPGDTYVWGDSNQMWYPKTHTATLVVDNDNGWGLFLSQNSSAARPDLPGYDTDTTGPVIYQTLPLAGLIGIFRPRTSDGINYAGDVITPSEEDEMSAADVAAIRGDLNTVHQAVLDGEQAVRADLNTVHQTIIRDVGGQLGSLAGELAATKELVKQLAAGQGVAIDYDRVEAAAKAGAAEALANGVDVNVTVNGKA